MLHVLVCGYIHVYSLAATRYFVTSTQTSLSHNGGLCVGSTCIRLKATHLLLCSGCECHNHAQSCRFDQAVYEASGRQSGGVCERCMHHTTGQQCEQCAPGYQPNPRSTMDQPDACTREWSTTIELY